ncbi:DUF4270 domain-containing protein [Flavobacterium sp. ACAM 123]|uniref:DUF4270 domain-containing protein n=1 Tax=Flavobacterium sp. ACAM 123 TaxID=1189620 RepID=UPI0002F543F8|nr:DUF4270 domain-containing protein [Flavobacterium sp. ACAM 123]
MYNNSFFKKILLVTCVVFLYSCDKDFNSIGDGLIGENHFDFVKYTTSVVAYNQKIGPIQSDNLPINALGIYDNPAFGTTTANFATQLVLESANPTIGKNPVIESVVLTIPYFSTLKSTDANGDGTYQLDSIYGSLDAKIMLSVFESGYFMRDLDPAGGFQEAQKYYTNQNSDFNTVKLGNRLNNSTDASQNDAFVFSAAQYKTTTTKDGKDVVTRVAPAMRLDLNASYFKTKIIDASGSGKLAGNDVFKEYFRGLYFKVEKSGSSPSNMALLDFKKGKITIKYKEDTSDTDATRLEKAIVLNLTGNAVSLLDQSNTTTPYANATSPANINTVLGDEKLYLKGGEGSLSIIELFGPDADSNGVADELETIRKNGWLINEANLVFHVDAGAMLSGQVAKRIYLYDFENNRPIFDYVTDPTTSGSNSKNGKTSYGGILIKDNAGNGTYKLRITNQIRVLVQNKDSTNIRLGVVVTEDINTTTSNKLRTSTPSFSQVPKASVMSPSGTILYGGKSTIPEDKRLKLEIYYTKPN